MGFNRLNYSFLANADSSDAPLDNASYYWISDPDGVAITHHLNLYGFRDRQWRVRRRSYLESRIFVVGDSFVEGFMVEADATIPRVMEREATAAGVRTEVMNLGIGGTQTPNYFRLIRDAVPLFRPDTIILILFANDLPAPPFDPSWLRNTAVPRFRNRWTPRLFTVIDELATTGRTARRWQSEAFNYLPAVPHPANPWSDKEFDQYWMPRIDPEIYRAMREARFNAYLVDNHAVMKDQLKRPLDFAPHLRALKSHLDTQGVDLYVVYIPEKIQVSDAYRPFSAKYSSDKDPDSLNSDDYRSHSKALAADCRVSDLHFLDLTPDIAAMESAGRRLYWNYDSHMNRHGYRLCAERIAEWWLHWRERHQPIKPTQARLKPYRARVAGSGTATVRVN